MSDERRLSLISATVSRTVIETEMLDPQISLAMRALDESNRELTIVATMPSDQAGRLAALLAANMPLEHARELAAALNRRVANAVLD